MIINPCTYDNVTSYPVLYLLHRFGGNYGGWVKDMLSSKSLADLHQMIFVCPDGGFSFWYFDSPKDGSYRYEIYIAKELTDWIDKNYKTIAGLERRAISVLSMGGHGGLYLGFRHQDVFGV